MRRLPICEVGLALGLYPLSESHEPEFVSLKNNWPANATAQSYWGELVGDENIKFQAGKSRATLIASVEMKVVQHILAHTIGARKSSHGCVSNFEIFQMYSMAHNWRIDVGYEVAKFFYRQATDPRAKGIFCGGYITKLLKGLKFFRNDPNDPGIPSPKISDAPFRLYGLVKLIDQRASPRYTTPPRGVSSPFAASTSQAPPPESEIQQLRREFQAERELNKRERQKNKRFRAAV